MHNKNQKEVELRMYKDLDVLRTPTVKDSVYFVLNSTTQKVNQIWVTNNKNIPKQVDLTTPIPDQDLVSIQSGNQIYTSSIDGKLQVNPIVSPDSSIEVINSFTQLQIQLSEELKTLLNSALQAGDNVSSLVNDGDGISSFITEEQLSSAIALNKDKNYYHDQGIPSDTWIIVHNLGKKPSVSVIDTAGTEVEGEIKYISLNEVKILFSASFSGNATLN